MGQCVCKNMFSLLKYQNSITEPVHVHVPDIVT
jgi:hypothetical protein